MAVLEKLKNYVIEAAIPVVKLLRKAELRIEQREHKRNLSRLTCLGNDGSIDSTVIITDPQSVSIGNNVFIGSGTYIMSLGGLQIRDNVHISRFVTIYCSDHDYKAGNALPYGPERVWKQVIIEKNVWIGMNVSILPGVTIGEGAIIGMGAVVSKDVPALAIVGQPPYRIIAERDRQQYLNAEANRSYGGRDGVLVSRERQRHFSQPGTSQLPQMCFVLTTGRSGSTTIAHMLNMHPKIEARHEPRRQMIKWSTDYAHGNLDADQTLRLLEQAFLEGSVYRNDVVHVESDQKYFNFIPFLRKLFPEAKFIWLVRSADSVVSSIVGRGWYSDEQHPVFARIGRYWHDFRLMGSKTGSFAEHVWDQMSQFEKCCWYWGYVNEIIERDLATVPETNKMILKLEDFDGKFSQIFDFMGVSLAAVPNNVTNRAYYQKYDRISWNRAEKLAYDQWCGPLMSRLYGYESNNISEVATGHTASDMLQ